MMKSVGVFEYLSKMEGIIPAIESAHAVAHAMKIAPTMNKDQIIVITISGRGDRIVRLSPDIKEKTYMNKI